MSWKMFVQIVLLIIITAVVFSAVKVAKYSMCKKGPRTQQEKSFHRSK